MPRAERAGAHIGHEGGDGEGKVKRRAVVDERVRVGDHDGGGDGSEVVAEG